MANKYAFTQAERHGVYMAHGERCYICGAALTMSTVQVDHVIPESVARDSVLFGQARSALGLPDDFEVNDFGNWLPSCATCNRTKGARVWDPSLIVQQAIQRALDRAPQAQKIANDLVTDRRLSRALSTIVAASEAGGLTPEIVATLAPLMAYQLDQRDDDLDNYSLHLTPFIDMLPFRFDTMHNFVPVLGTGDMVNFGKDFAISGPGFVVSVKFELQPGERDRYLRTDVYRMQPTQPRNDADDADDSPVVRLTPHQEVTRTVGGIRVTLRSMIQEIDELWVAVSSS